MLTEEQIKERIKYCEYQMNIFAAQLYHYATSDRDLAAAHLTDCVYAMKQCQGRKEAYQDMLDPSYIIDIGVDRMRQAEKGEENGNDCSQE